VTKRSPVNSHESVKKTKGVYLTALMDLTSHKLSNGSDERTCGSSLRHTAYDATKEGRRLSP
jgi:hypothetical protein